MSTHQLWKRKRFEGKRFDPIPPPFPYLRRKASGWQRQYEERTRAAKKAKIDAGKAAIRAEDMARGLFIPVSQLPKQEPQKALAQIRTTV